MYLLCTSFFFLYMRTLITILLLTNFCVAQNKNLVISYGLVFEKDELFSKDINVFTTHLDYAIQNPNRFLFDLKIDSKGSSFDLKDQLSIAEHNLSDEMSMLFARYTGVIFSFRDSILTQSDLLGKKVFVKTGLISDWNLTKDFKDIDGYKCYKATNVYKVTNSVGVFNHEVIAWYCPEIPYSYGPLGYGNLPGLILQLQVRNVIYGALKINLQSKDLPDYSILDKSEIISGSEEKRRLKKFFESQN